MTHTSPAVQGTCPRPKLWCLRDDHRNWKRRSWPVVGVALGLLTTSLGTESVAAAESWSPPTPLTDTGYRMESPELQVERRSAVLTYIRGRDLGSHQTSVVVRDLRDITKDGAGEVLPLGSPQTARGPRPVTDVNSAGDLAVAWSESETSVGVKIRRADRSWTEPVTFDVARVDRHHSWNTLHVQLNDSGAAVVWWQVSTEVHDPHPSRAWVSLAYRSSEGEWQAPVDVAKFDRIGADIDAKVGPTGNVLTTYRKNGHILVKSRKSDGSWASQQQIASVDAGVWDPNPRLETTRDGSMAMVSWRDDKGLHAIRRDGSRWGRAVRFNKSPACDPDDSLTPCDLVLDNRGHITAAWVSSHRSILAADWPRDDRSFTRTRIAPRPSNGHHIYVTNLDLETNGRGDTVLVWFRWSYPRRFEPRLLSAYRKAGAGWEARQRVAESDISEQPDAAVRRDGDVELVWQTDEVWHAHRSSP